MSSLRRVSVVLVVSLVLNVALTALWLRARRTSILPTVAKATLRQEPASPPTVEVQFATDMAMEAVDPAAPPVVFIPPVDGTPEYLWRSPRLLAVAADGLIPGRTYQVRSRDGLRDARGLPLDNRTQPFVSQPLKLVGPVEVERISAGSSRLVLPFNGPVFPEDLARRTVLQCGPETCPAEAVQAEYARRAVLTFHHSASAAKAMVRIEPGLKAQDADVATTEPITQEVELVPHLRITRAWCPDREGGQLSIRIGATTSLLLEGLAEKIEISPPATFRISRDWEGIRLVGDFRPRTFYRVTFRKGIQGILSTKLDEDTVFTVVTARRRPELRFLANGPLLPRSRASELTVHLSSVQEATFTAWRVYPRNYVEYFWNDWECWYGSEHARYGTRLNSHTFQPKLEDGKEEVRTVPLDELFDGQSTGLFVVEADGGAGGARDRRRVILTDIGLGVARDRESTLVWALSLRDGTPIADCRIEIFSDKDQPIGTGLTDRTGAALIVHGKLPDDETPYLVTAQHDDDLSMLQLDHTGVHNQVPFALTGRPYPAHAYEAFAYTERGVCRPGERIVAGTFVRDDGALRAAADLPVEMRVRDPLGRMLHRIPRTLNGDGFATARFEIPFDARTGDYTVQVAMPGDGPVWGESRFTVGCYRPDQIRLGLSLDQPEYQLPDARVLATVDGRFYFGAPASDCPVTLRWRFAQTPFQPKGYEEYRFGDARRTGATFAADPTKGATDGEGTARLTFLPLPEELPAAAWGVNVTAELAAPSGATVSAHAKAKLHPYPFYLGLKREWKPEAPPQDGVLAFAWVAVTPDGKAVAPANKITCELYRREYSYVHRREDGRYVRQWVEQWFPIAKGDVPGAETSTGGTFTVHAPQSGSYRLILSDGGLVSTTDDFWYSAGDGEFARPASPTALPLETDKPAYLPGDTALVSFQSPAAGQALLILSGKSVLQTVPVAVQAGGNTVSLTIPSTIPYASLFVSATVVCPFENGHDATQRLFGLARLALVQDGRRLSVGIEAAATARPNGELPVTIRLSAADQPRRGTVQLLAVDEGVLALTAYRTPDPFAHFFAPRSCSLVFADVYDQIFPDLSAEYGDASPIGGDGSLASFFNPAAGQEVKEAVVLARLVHVDESGTAQVTLRLPEHTGALRLMAVAANETQLGAAEKEVQVHHPIALQLAAPRAVAPGDTFQATASIFNTELPETDIELRFAAEGTVKLTGEATVRVRLAKGQRHVVRIPVQAAGKEAGPGVLRVVAIAGGHQQEARCELSCRPASPPIFRASFDVQDAGGKREFRALAGMLPGTGDCELQISADPALELAPAMSWLLRYDYGCLEQTLSRVVPLLALREISDQLLLPAIANSQEGSEWEVRQALLRLSTLEQPYGGYGTWPGANRIWVGGSVYACHFLYEAQRAGYPVDGDMAKRARIFLRRLIEEFQRYPQASTIERAYAVYLLAAFGEPEPGIAQGIAEDAKSNSFARFLAAAALVRGGQAAQGNAILQPLLAQEDIWSGDGSTFDSLPRRIGLALAILADTMPDSPHCVRLAASLRHLRNGEGHWGNTQANAMAVWGLSRWLHAQGSGTGRGSVTVNGTTTEIAPGKPFRIALDDPSQSVEIATTDGRLYISWQQRGVPMQAPTEDVGQNLRFRRQYLAEDGTETTTFAQGDLIRIRLTFICPDYIDRFVLADVLPGGVEIEDGSLATRTQETAKRDGLWTDVVEKRDDRLVLSGELHRREAKHPGVYEYHVRAVTPGQFAIPRLVAESMYNPAQRAETGSGTLTIRPVP